MKTPKAKKVKETDYVECTRCNINSLGKQMCPCPRGSCDAEVVGKVIVTTEVIKFPKKKEKKISKKKLKHNENVLYLLSNID